MGVLGLGLGNGAELLDEAVEELIEERLEARRNREL